ncbi:hypothetical protein LCGC14_0873890 [marine sediment metagenome]|uniref:DUF2769 domain-containing protein n=1 Tax=marine sediment metagenome TaxID=412755 RepID=A0A0F9PPK0_9ZZZZ|nr:MAG: hypothetical protein Lokiarch_41260 [Candidatus Lokiarchaeum sp. GC14_75]HEC39972.1 DUF2769 domain-containing protein [bacterium]
MAKPVPDDEASMDICRKFCGPCPSFKPNKLNEFEPHALFCSRGQTKKPKDQVENKGCSCFGCGLFPKYELEKGFFCAPWFQK